MPFYLRTRARRPIWHAAAAGAGAMLAWTLAQLLLRSSAPNAVHAGALRQATLVLVLTLVGGTVAGVLSWAFGLGPVHRSLTYRLAAGTVGSLVYLIALTLAASQSEPAGVWSRISRPSVLLSSLVLSLVFGWLIAKDPFSLARDTERIYLTPLQFAALPPSEQERLLADAGPQGPKDAGSAG